MRILSAIFLSVLCASAFADVAPTPPPAPAPLQRVSVFSTTVDWAAVTGLPLNQYTGTITGTDKSLVKEGLVLYYLDSFPCYGEADSVRVWLGQNRQSTGRLRLVCVHAPKTVSFAWRNATRDADQAQSTGILTCPVDGDYDFTIDISKCTYGPEWGEYK